ncbi:DUF3817 domain-containing protein [Gordonia sp. zg691]|uniref:DUF3817 domain-containing protein n=1 Tax=Gordonia jinghuaiqii TaxID=2758710 RepID=A0A7D7R2A4_9ACTN|nr:DUF3817 domain-containing protein [Gordonia jinghuaiqii]MBD0864012.1 DUF3817 domain-containing protein [Gordonia jinghuaiqii]MCR5980549.1 DUF3817 domain-containing protein [Gordonia jinghuaiqii]QMT03291.1 DUF3817 domain-containing protein [Gordonia jinghuaiqii]
MLSFFDLRTPAKRFRLVAVAEAITWAWLLVGMVLKRVNDDPEAIAMPGATHGAVFVLFVIVALVTAFQLKWNAVTWELSVGSRRIGVPIVTLLALASSVPPFGTIVFEWWARRNGYLAELSTAAPARQATA